MIKIDKGNVEIEGSALEILAEISTMIHEVCYEILIERCDATPEQAKEDIMHAVERAFLIEDEMRDTAAEALENVLEKAAKLLGDLLNRKGDK